VAPIRIGASRAEHGALERVRVCALSGGAPGPACHHTVHEWVPAGTVLETCAMHESVAIERRSGRRAGPTCDPRDVETRVFERFPPEYAAWAQAAHRDVAPEEWSTSCAPAPGSRTAYDAHRVAVAWPRDGATFLVDPGRPRAQQAIAVRVLAPESAERVTLRVDGAPVGRVGSPFVAQWTLTEGDHVLVAEAAGLAPSAPVHVRVH
jgi:hypothetical protein